MLMVAWDFENRSEPGGVGRSIRGWLARGGEWSQFMEDEWTTAPSRAPWRILPRGSARLTVGEEDALESIAYKEGLRDLVTVVGPTLREWRGQRGEIYRLSEGTTILSGAPSEGYVLDVSTARLSGALVPQEWALLVGEDNLQVLLADPEGPGDYRAWAREDFQDLSWPVVTVEWSEMRSFERARRDVPVVWSVTSENGDLSGEIEATSSHVQTFEGDGPRLPVLGVYEVIGHLEIGGARQSVRGFLHHVQNE